MAKQTKFKPIKTAAGWQINVPPKFSQSGKRERHHFRTRDLAAEAAEKLRKDAAEFGRQSQAIPPSLAEQATAAAALLAPFKLTVLEAAEIVAAMRQRESASVPATVATAAWYADCEGVLRTKTLAGYRHTVQRLDRALGNRSLATITAPELLAAIAPPGTPPTAAAGHHRTARAFWNWAAKRDWCRADVFDKVELPRARRDSPEITILTPEECRALLDAAAKYFPAAVPSFALQLFAGIRAEEITRLEAADVAPGGIELGAEATKKGRRRHIVPNDCLKAWLEKHPFEPCPDWKRSFDAVRRLAGWQVAAPKIAELVRAGKIAKAPKPHRGAWPQNAMRHSHATYSLAVGATLESLLFEFGHTGNPATLRAHYAGRASKKTALEYFSTMPEGTAAPATIQSLKAV